LSHGEPLETPQRALAIGAHPDDIEFGCGGTLARWASEGAEVSLLVMTDGSKGTWDPTIPSEELTVRRASEQRDAAALLGARNVELLNHVDGELVYTMDLRAELCAWVRRFRPDVVLGHDPWKRYMLHPDHRAAGLAVVDGVVAARDHLFFPEQGLPKHRPGALLLWSADQDDHWEDISATIEQKAGALLAHSSQGESTMGDAQEGGDAAQLFIDRIHEHAANAAEETPYRYAEAFKRLTP